MRKLLVNLTAFAFVLVAGCGHSCCEAADPPKVAVQRCPAGHIYCDCGCITGGTCTCSLAKAGTCTDPAYKAAKEQAIRESRPLFVYVGQPVANIPWDQWYMNPVTVSVKDFPDAKAPCVVVGKPAPAYPAKATDLDRIADLPGSPNATVLQATYFHLYAAPVYQPVYVGSFGGCSGGCCGGSCRRR